MSTRIFIDGAAGTTGLEILDRLKDREEFELIRLDDAQRKDAGARREALNAADIAILCLPDDAAREAVAMIDPEGTTRVIDASSAHRVADGWTYGFPEIIGHERVAEARFVSNPGCYPTGFLALIAPLTLDLAIPSKSAEERSYSPFVLSPSDGFVVNGISGFSGGGKTLVERFAKEPHIGYRRYAIEGEHKHLAEMQKHAGLTSPPVFLPAVAAVYRGMIVEVPLRFLPFGKTLYWQKQALAKFYEGSPVIKFKDEAPTELLLDADAEPWDGMDLYCVGWDDEKPHASGAYVKNIRLIARLDNLGKGASGAAIQNLNIMCGIPETTGLRL